MLSETLQFMSVVEASGLNMTILDGRPSQPEPILSVLCAIYGTLFTVGMVGNVSVTVYLVCILLNKAMEKSRQIQVLVLSLSIADTLVLICLPAIITGLYRPSWPLGTLLCKLHWVCENTNKILSTFLHLLLSSFCFINLRRPMAHGQLVPYRWILAAILVCVSLAAFLMMPIYRHSDVKYLVIVANQSTHPVNLTNGPPPLALPTAHLHPLATPPLVNNSTNWPSQTHNMPHQPSHSNPRPSLPPVTTINITYHQIGVKCTFDPPESTLRIFTIYIFVVCFCIPTVLQTLFYIFLVCYVHIHVSHVGQSAIPIWKVTRTSIILLSFYLVCWTPHWLVTLYHVIGRPSQPPNEDMYNTGMYFIYMAIHTLPFVNAAINPSLYVYLNKTIRLSGRASHTGAGGGRSSAAVSRSQNPCSNVVVINNNNGRLSSKSESNQQQVGLVAKLKKKKGANTTGGGTKKKPTQVISLELPSAFSFQNLNSAKTTVNTTAKQRTNEVTNARSTSKRKIKTISKTLTTPTNEKDSLKDNQDTTTLSSPEMITYKPLTSRESTSCSSSLLEKDDH